jgi:hypothetical protein
LFNTLGIPVQLALFAIGIGLLAKGLAIHAETKFQVAIFMQLIVMIDQGSLVIYPECAGLWMTPDGILPGTRNLLFSRKQEWKAFKMAPFWHCPERYGEVVWHQCAKIGLVSDLKANALSKNGKDYVEIILKKKGCFRAKNEVSPLNFSKFVDRGIKFKTRGRRQL